MKDFVIQSERMKNKILAVVPLWDQEAIKAVCEILQWMIADLYLNQMKDNCRVKSTHLSKATVLYIKIFYIFVYIKFFFSSCKSH